VAESRIRIPAMPAPAERLAPLETLARIVPEVAAGPRMQAQVVGSSDSQRFRAAARIRIREPELWYSIPGQLPFPSASMRWLAARMVSQILRIATPVPLRPSLQTPDLLHG
jgi:hypothetical protein